jgi:hypothetical protein
LKEAGVEINFKEDGEDGGIKQNSEWAVLSDRLGTA